MAGEDAQERGREGMERAREWLNLTTRVSSTWTHDTEPLAELLHYQWPDNSGQFSFDLGGYFRGGALDGQSFAAEVKNYAYDNHLKQHFRDFLAKCYVDAIRSKPRYRHYLWISWAPFAAGSWNKHGTPDDVKAAVVLPRNRSRCLNASSEDEALKNVSADAIAYVGDRVWLVTMNDKQNQLVVTKEHFALITAQITNSGGA